MSNVIEFKKKKGQMPDDFLEQLHDIEQLYLQGFLDRIVIVGQGKEIKVCTSNGIKVKEAKKICNDFCINTKEYVD